LYWADLNSDSIMVNREWTAPQVGKQKTESSNAPLATNSRGTDQVWFYDVEADGMSLDDKRTPLLGEDKLRAVPKTTLNTGEHCKNNLPDILARWQKREGSERKRPRTAQSFCVPKADLVAQGYDLSLNRYKEVGHEEVAHRPPMEILAELVEWRRTGSARFGQLRCHLCVAQENATVARTAYRTLAIAVVLFLVGFCLAGAWLAAGPRPGSPKVHSTFPSFSSLRLLPPAPAMRPSESVKKEHEDTID
jgi:hypothetical protein